MEKKSQVWEIVGIIFIILFVIVLAFLIAGAVMWTQDSNDTGNVVPTTDPAADPADDPADPATPVDPAAPVTDPAVETASKVSRMGFPSDRELMEAQPTRFRAPPSARVDASDPGAVALSALQQFTMGQRMNVADAGQSEVDASTIDAASRMTTFLGGHPVPLTWMVDGRPISPDATQVAGPAALAFTDQQMAQKMAMSMVGDEIARTEEFIKKRMGFTGVDEFGVRRVSWQDLRARGRNGVAVSSMLDSAFTEDIGPPTNRQGHAERSWPALQASGDSAIAAINKGNLAAALQLMGGGDPTIANQIMSM